jgi:autotransporter-associated beta strand protein
VNLTNSANNFSGNVIYTEGNGTRTFNVNSIGDSGKVIFGLGGSTQIFNLGSTAASGMTFNTRQFELAGAGGTARIGNYSGQAFTIIPDLLITGTGTRTMELQGTGAGVSTFAGDIGDGTLTSLAITKAEAGTWILSGTNTYTGITTVSAGTLEIGGSGMLGNGNYAGNISIASTSFGNLKYNSTADQTLGGVISGAGALVKDNSGALTLTNANTYAGITTVSNGKLLINGSLSNTAVALNVSSGATLGGTGAVGRNVTIASGGKLEFDIRTDAVSHNGLDISTGRSFGFAGASTLTITSAGGASPGIYTLITGGNNISGATLPTLNLPVGWAATVSISGNSLLLDVSSTGLDHFAISSIASPQTVGTAITGITITAQDSVNATVTSFTGTVTFGGTAGITGASASFVAGVLTGVSVTPTVAGVDLTLTVDDGFSHTGSSTFTVRSVFNSWASGSGLSGGNAVYGANPDGDSLTNLQEFAFGMNPNSPVLGQISYVSGGAATAGVPMLEKAGAIYRAVFARRKDYQAAGISYEVSFSADLTRWTPVGTAPVRLSAVNADPVEAVSIDFPDSVALQEGGSATPRFFRVAVTGN